MKSMQKLSILMMPPSKLTYVRKKRSTSQKLGLTPLQKYDLCCLRQKYPKLKLSQFVELEDREDEGGGIVMGHGGPQRASTMHFGNSDMLFEVKLG